VRRKDLRRGKGSKIMAFFREGSSIPLALHTESASPHEVTLVEPTTLASAFVKEKPERLIGDKAYDSDPLDETLLQRGIELIAPHRKNRKKKKSQDGRKLSGATRGAGRSRGFSRGFKTSGGWWFAMNTRMRTSWAWLNLGA
jgi:Transposase DDE domain